MSNRMMDVLAELRRIGAVSAPPPVKFLEPEPEPAPSENAASDEGVAAVMGTFQKPFNEATDDEDEAEESSSEGSEDAAEDDEDSDEDSTEAPLDETGALKEALERLAMLEDGVADLRELLAAMLAAKEK